jgi:hypothetical protein
MTRSEVNGKVWVQTAKGAVLPIATLLLVMFMIVPVPSFVLDMGFIGNIVISLAVLMVALNAPSRSIFRASRRCCCSRRLMRLALNVASTRVVLVDGHTGAAAAGHVIEAFGAFPDRRRLCRRPVRLRDPDDHQPRRHHQGRGPRVRGVGALHPGRLAGQADGDRRRPERRAAHARRSQGPPFRSRDRGRLSTARWTVPRSS